MIGDWKGDGIVVREKVHLDLNQFGSGKEERKGRKICGGPAIAP